VLFIVVGLGFIAAGVFLARSSLRMSRTGERTTAEVVGRVWRGRGGADGGGGYHPVVRFRTADGRVVQTHTRVGGLASRARIGTRVKVIYNPRVPEDAVIDSPLARGTIGGVVFVLAGVWLIVSHFS
jgi:regulator of protease activity HflC (stomatin/prohibitin superfamily)